MMKINTDGIPGWEGRNVTLRFLHGVMVNEEKGVGTGEVVPYPKTTGRARVEPVDPRATVALVHEHMRLEDEHVEVIDPKDSPEEWAAAFQENKRRPWVKKKNGEGYTRLLGAGVTRCSKKDRYCKETGRQLAVKHLRQQDPRHNPWRDQIAEVDLALAGAIIHQYFENRSALRRTREA